MGDTNKKKPNNRGFNRFRFSPFNRNAGPRERPISMQIPQQPSTSTAGINNNNRSPAADPNQTQNETQSFRIDDPNAEYPGWKLYFPQEEYKPDSNIVRKVRSFEEHIKKYPLLYKLQQIRQTLWFALPLQRVLGDTNFVSKWHNFVEDINENTEETLLCAGLAAHQRIQKDLTPLTQSELTAQKITSKLSLVTIRARIQGHSPIISLRALKQDNYSRLISVKGTVIRVNAPEIICTWLAFRCAQCGCEQAIRQRDRAKVITPISCKGVGCRARSNFQPLQASPFTRSEPYQTIRMQESMQQYDAMGQIPKSIEVELAYDLVDSVCPGDDVTLTGVIKVRVQDDGHYGGGGAGQASMHRFYIHAVTIVSNKNSINVKNSDFSEHEMSLFEQIKNSPNPFSLLVHSLCPMIFGHEMVKAGLILALFGGSGDGNASADENSNPKIGKRSEIHVLIMGDPGIGKSHLLQACANVSPRGYFVCGNSTSNAGLTVSIRHEKGTGDSMEAGALVLADQGVCCIDEFDKMTANYQSLLQVMEQQTVSVAKAGVLCALPARTCLLAAANPSGGHYDKSKTVSENLKVWPTLLSRFDLVFILLDRADQHLDDLLTAHIQALSKNNINPPRTQQSQSTSRFGIFHNEPNYASATAPLCERLRLENPHDFTPIPHDIMQKYIGYAKKYCFPTLSQDASEELKKFYLELRKTRPGVDSIPVTTRQLEALIRLTQARARLELVPEATIHHAKDILSILRYTMVDVLSTDEGTLQMRRNINGTGMSQATQNKKYLQMLQRQCKTIFTYDELMEVAALGGFQANLRNIIDALNVQGFLIKRGQGIYRFMN